jgi:hypothetical protein
MKREQLIKHWTFMEAFRNGKQLQYRYGDSWRDVSDPSFDIGTEYRIKPEKKTAWLNIYPNGYAVFYPTKEVALSNPDPHPAACIQITYEEGEGL